VAREDARYTRAKREIDVILNDVKASGRSNLRPDEEKRSNQCFAEAESAREARDEAKARLERAQAVEADERRLDALSADVRPTGVRTGTRTATFSVGRNERTYRPDTDPHGRQFLLDVARSATFNDTQSHARLEAHMNEERVERPGLNLRAAGDATTTAF